jgi:hypothetical protein
VILAKKPNYGFQKQQKELKKQAKRQAKEDKKRLKSEEQDAAPARPDGDGGRS